jgi:hypothetical protein|tara:strand:- start:7360 stop:7941 length:582 start_codon:yes stop_codon:yes gene_type:complete
MTFRTGATFSDDMKYRYRLWRHWDDGLLALMFLLLNPSTADEFENDPTVTRCMERAKRMGFGGVEICNLYAYRATDPKELYGPPDAAALALDDAAINDFDPIGEDNPTEIYAAVGVSGAVICGWGVHGEKIAPPWPAMVLQGLALQLEGWEKPLLHLGLNDDGSPKHPLYIGYDVPVEPFGWPDDDSASSASG